VFIRVYGAWLSGGNLLKRNLGAGPRSLGGSCIQRAMVQGFPVRRSLEDERFQVIVIGGGINGVAIARQCARAGRRTLLLEQHDFAAGTTSRSTRIIHGGLRYLEHGEIGLVRESLKERERLLQERPHLVHPMQFLLALDKNSRRSALNVRAGLWLYRKLAGARSGMDSGREERRKLERLLDTGQNWSIFSFEDAQCEFPERLVAEWLVEAVEAGAVGRNYTEALAVDVRYGRVAGVLVRDRRTGKEERIETTWVINATGPWIDHICQRSQVTKAPMIGGVRGSHIVLPRFAGAPDAAVYTEALDGRPVFLIPWNEQLLVGTTEVPDHHDPGKAQPSNEEIAYLFRSVLQLYPRTKLSEYDIRFSFSGIRPLSSNTGVEVSAVTRKHYLHDHKRDGVEHMISVIGGKLTTAANLARECGQKIGVSTRSAPTLALAPAGSLEMLLEPWTAELTNAGLSEDLARSIVEWHGKRSPVIARLAKSGPEFRTPLCSHCSHIVAEAVDAFGSECALTLADVLLRRVPVAFGACWSQSCAREAAARIGAAMQWDHVRTATELEDFEMEKSTFLRPPGNLKAMLPTAAD
jgi:glycerol-3-phosphate dehydrogenase